MKIFEDTIKIPYSALRVDHCDMTPLFSVEGNELKTTASTDVVVSLAQVSKSWAQAQVERKRGEIPEGAKKKLPELLAYDPLQRLQEQGVRNPRELIALVSFLPGFLPGKKKSDLGNVEVETSEYPEETTSSGVHWFIQNFEGTKIALPSHLRLVQGYFGGDTGVAITSDFFCHDVQIRRKVEISKTAMTGKTLPEILKRANIPLATEDDVQITRDLCAKAQEIQGKHGTVLVTRTRLWTVLRGWSGIYLDSMPGGTKSAPLPLVVEGDLEVDTNLEERKLFILPFVRVFHLERKEYVYALASDLEPHTWDEQAWDRVVLDALVREVIEAAFRPGATEVFGDLFAGRHGGIVILAAGPPGVGKTLTAEAAAKRFKMPLYTLGIGELGTTADKVEHTLDLVIERVTRWGALLLLDEGDIFLSKRKENELERSAIVGVFLRRLDTYSGVLFLTTNRAEHLDDAMLSRCTLKITYPPILGDRRRKIWQGLLDAAGLKYSDRDLNEVSELDLNGREARNALRAVMVRRSAKSIEGPFDAQEIKDLLPFLRPKAV